MLEEVDCFPVQTSASALYVDFMLALSGTIVAASGRDCLWGAAFRCSWLIKALPPRWRRDIALLRGGAPIAEFFQLTGEQMRDKVIASANTSAQHFDAALALLNDQSFGPLQAAILRSGVSVVQLLPTDTQLTGISGCYCLSGRLLKNESAYSRQRFPQSCGRRRAE